MIYIDIIAEIYLSPEDAGSQLNGDETPQPCVLWGGIGELDVMRFFISLARYNRFPDCNDFSAIGRAAAQAERLVLGGGIRIVSSKNVILPGCCCGVETWREQLRALEGYPVWLGHDPAPWSEVIGEEVRFWQDGGFGRDRVDFPVQIMRSEIPALQEKLIRDMAGFLYALRRWSRFLMETAVAEGFAAKLDTAWQISSPK